MKGGWLRGRDLNVWVCVCVCVCVFPPSAVLSTILFSVLEGRRIRSQLAAHTAPRRHCVSVYFWQQSHTATRHGKLLTWLLFPSAATALSAVPLVLSEAIINSLSLSLCLSLSLSLSLYLSRLSSQTHPRPKTLWQLRANFDVWLGEIMQCREKNNPAVIAYRSLSSPCHTLN